MRNKFILTLILLATSFSSPATDFKSVPLVDAFSPPAAQQIKNNALPFQFTVPETYEKQYVPEKQTVLWGTREDIDSALTTGKLNKSKHGLFTLKISLNVGYDDQTKRFTGEDQMENAKNQPGLSDVTFHRTQIKGFPMATFTAVTNDRHLFLHYIALGSATLLINYFHPETLSAKDLEIWSQFISGLKSQN